MKGQRNRSEKGQILVLIILAIVALLGFTALAIDVGTIYSNRRTAQNAADAAAYAGAAKISQIVKIYSIRSFKCSTVMPLAAPAYVEAVDRAADNDFTIEQNLLNQNGVNLVCNDSATDPYIDVHVVITQPVDTSFVHFVNSSTATNTVEAVVRVRPRQLFADGAAIVALRNACGNGTSVFAPTPNPKAQWDGGLTFDGSFNITVKGGGAHSNDCCTVSGTGGELNLEPGTFVCNGEIKVTKPHPPDPYPVPGEDIPHQFKALKDLVKARCDGMSDATISTEVDADGVTWTVYSAGKHASITSGGSSADHIKLASGLHCFMASKSTFTVTSNNSEVKGEHITIFMDDDAGDLTLLGGKFNLTPPVANCDVPAIDTNGDGCPPAVGGMLILYAPVDSQGGGTPTQVRLGGNSETYYEGSILAPWNKIELGGTNQTISEIGAQLIADTVLVHGNVNLTIEWDPDLGIRLPSFMNLQK